MAIRLTFFLLLLSTFGFGQAGYSIKCKIDGLKPETKMILGYYYGESTYARDTAIVDQKANFSFDGEKLLDKGVYFIAINKNGNNTRIYEFVIGDDQDFKMETDTIDYVGHIKITGDRDNQIFFENVNHNIAKQKEAEPYRLILNDSTLIDAEKENAKKQFDRITKELFDYREQIIQKNKGTIAAKLFLVTQPLTAPAAPKLANGMVDSTFQLKWYREHWFDNLELANDAMLRMPKPFYSERVNEYLDKLYVPQADTINKVIDMLVARAKPNKETYKYMVYTLLLKYQHPEIMGLDGIFVHLYDKYFATGEMDYWANQTFKNNLKEHADRLRKSLIGAKGADLVMMDQNSQRRSMYDIRKKYTILYFFDPDCPACKKETPKLAEFYEKNRQKFDVEVFAVSADTSMQKMRDYIKEMNLKWITVNGPRTYTGPYHEKYDSVSTPTLYILDDKKVIIAKKVPAEQIENFLINYEKYHKKGT